LCEPCNYLAKITSAKALLGFVHKGGLRARILTDGYLRVGDTIVVE
jgi:MOSC domain-containing protein YiiM